MNCSLLLRYSTLFILLNLILLGQNFAQSQVVFSKAVNSKAYIENVWPTNDGGYIAGGVYQWFDTSISAINYDHYILKTDSAGNTLWERIYDFTTNDGWCLSGSTIRELSDGGFAYIGAVNCGQNGWPALSKYNLLRLDSSGDTLWTKTYEHGLRSMGQWVEPTADGGFIMTGYAANFGSSADAYVVKTDSLGAVEWTKEYELELEEQTTCVRQTADGGYILVGGSSNPNVAPKARTWLLKLDAIGDTLWTKVYPWGMWQINAFVEVTPDNGYIVSVKDSSIHQRVFKTDSLGEIEWTKNFGQGTGCVAQTADNEFAVFGNNYFTKTDASGNMISSQTTNFSPVFWRATPDNGFITTTGNHLIKTDCEGNRSFWDTLSCPAPIIPQDTSAVTLGNVEVEQTSDIVVFPNPTEGVFTLEGSEIGRIEIFDITGKSILNAEATTSSTTLNLSEYKKGLYFVKVVTNAKTNIIKLVVQ